MAHLQQQEVHIAARPRPRHVLQRPPRHGRRLLPVEHLRACGRSPLRRSPARPAAADRRSWRRPPITPSSARWSTTRSPGPPPSPRCSAPPSPSRTPAPRRVGPWPASRSATARSPSTRCPGTTAPRCGAAPTSGRAPTCWRCAWTTSVRRPTHCTGPASRSCAGRRDLVVLDPAATGGVQVALTGSCSRATPASEPGASGDGIDPLDPDAHGLGQQLVVELEHGALPLARPADDRRPPAPRGR